MSTLIELRQQYGNLMTQAETISKAGFTAETRAKFDAMMVDADAMYADIKRQEKIAQFSSEQRAVNAPPRDNFTAVNNDAQKEFEKRAFLQWMRTGSSAGVETRDLGIGTATGSITGGNVLVPTTLAPLVDAKLSYGNLLDYVSILRTNHGNPISIPTANDTGNGLTLLTQATANTTELDPSFSSVAASVDSCTSETVKISNELLQDSYFDLPNWINEKLSLRWARGFANWISLGNSSNVAALSYSGGVTSAASGVVAYPDLAALYGSLNAAYAVSGEFVMSSATRASLMGIVSTTGQPILQSDANGNPFSAIFGRPIVIDEKRPAIAASAVGPILFGDASQQYTARIAGDFRIVRMNELFVQSNETGFQLFARVGGANTDAGSHPMKALTVHA